MLAHARACYALHTLSARCASGGHARMQSGRSFRGKEKISVNVKMLKLYGQYPGSSPQKSLYVTKRRCNAGLKTDIC